MYLLCSFLLGLVHLNAQDNPKGKLTYCSYAREGLAALGTDYCELIADSTTQPRIVVVKNHNCHFAEREEHTYEVSPEVVAQMQELLEKVNLNKVNGYNKESNERGGHEYRFHIEYDSGVKIHASWHTHTPKAEAVSVYNMIEQFFAPWRNHVAVKEEADTTQVCSSTPQVKAQQPTLKRKTSTKRKRSFRTRNSRRRK